MAWQAKKLCINKVLWDGRLARPVRAFRPTPQKNLLQHFSLAAPLRIFSEIKPDSYSTCWDF
ncbi:hypothetical protein [Nostoc sp. DSM 114159]